MRMTVQYSGKLAVVTVVAAAALGLAAPGWAATADDRASERGQDASQAGQENSARADDAAGDHPAAHSNPPVADRHRQGGEETTVPTPQSTAPGRHAQERSEGATPPDPDDDGRGPDRGDGGADTADADRGCGNDGDGTDDNEGLCGLLPGSLSEAGEQGSTASTGARRHGDAIRVLTAGQRSSQRGDGGDRASDRPRSDDDGGGDRSADGTPIVGVGVDYDTPRALGLAALGVGLLVGATLISLSGGAALRRRRTAL